MLFKHLQDANTASRSKLYTSTALPAWRQTTQARCSHTRNVRRSPCSIYFNKG